MATTSNYAPQSVTGVSRYAIMQDGRVSVIGWIGPEGAEL